MQHVVAVLYAERPEMRFIILELQKLRNSASLHYAEQLTATHSLQRNFGFSGMAALIRLQ